MAYPPRRNPPRGDRPSPHPQRRPKLPPKNPRKDGSAPQPLRREGRDPSVDLPVSERNSDAGPTEVSGHQMFSRDERSSNVPRGRVEVTEPITPPDTEPEAEVNIKASSDDLTITSHPPTVDIEETAKKRFAEAPQVVIANAENALAITVALQDILRNERSNSDEANEAKDLLERQHAVLANIIEALRLGGDEEAARKSAAQLLGDLMASILANLSSDGPVRGTLAIAAISIASILGVDLHWTTQLLVTGSFVGKEVIDALRDWRPARKLDKDD